MKFFIVAALISVAAAVPYDGHGLAYEHAPLVHAPVVHHPATVVTTHAKTYYAPITQTKYGSQVNHLVNSPPPIIKEVPQPYEVPVPYAVPVKRPVPVMVPRPVYVDVPRKVGVPMVVQAAPLVTKSVVHAAPVHAPLAHGYAGHGYAGHGYAGHGFGY
ncbi:hypothetical protein RDWZM_005005 [Blomia tropicalis]|uniref:Uncharacterized protein n=1 Tax=Blomia tropicalis TaxID=40697 RepID=A0A9Q0M5W1_BLOTA|nr:hypothetical protein BLOT_005392 [Blomia tropicalis]KAJ6219193.1 hypothetical protein RDWZM_005005 [Blomia tropicalis]